MNSVEGKIFIDVFPESRSDSRVKITSSRPLELSKMFIGKSPEQVLMFIPMMFNICGIAQSRAALSAIQQNLKIVPDPKLDIAHEILLQVEIAREHLMRIFLDWPGLLDFNWDKGNLVDINNLTGNFNKALFGANRAFSLNKPEIDVNHLDELIQHLELFLRQNVFSSPCENWLENSDIGKWSGEADTLAAKACDSICQIQPESLGTVSIRHLPLLDNEALVQRLDDDNADAFIAQPDWSGIHYETTSLSRQCRHPLIRSVAENPHNALLLRWLARLTELATIPQILRQLQRMFRQNDVAIREEELLCSGLSQVETARGRLIHRVNIEEGLINKYQILAPTEWNFHPRGVVTQSLAGLNTTDKTELSRLSHLLINAIDPCVGYELNIH